VILAARYRRAGRAVVSINRQRGTECAAYLALVGGDHYARALAGDPAHRGGATGGDRGAVVQWDPRSS
jgi:hypothetical protein